MGPGNEQPYLPPHLKSRIRQLRRDSTIPERLLWSLLRGRGLGGLKFRRQHPIGPFVADFFCEEVGLVVEVDGRSHDERYEQDQRREDYLKGLGFRVLRVGNDDVLEDLESVALAILRAAGIELERPKSEGVTLSATLTPTLSQGEREEESNLK